MRALVVLGSVLLGVAAMLAMADSDRLSRRMPTQVPPRWMAGIPLSAGVLLLVAAGAWFGFDSL